MIRMTCGLVLIVSFGSASPSSAEFLYSIDRVADRLVLFNTSTAAILDIGPIGFDMRATQLTLHEGVLYGLTGNADGFDSTAFTLVGIDPNTGGALSTANVTFNGQNLRVADGLESVGGKLVVAFRDPNLGPGSESQRLGDLSLSGAITNADNFAAFNPDFDALGTNETGQLHSVDGVNDQLRFDFYTVNRSPNPLDYDLVGTFTGGTLAQPFNSHELAYASSSWFVLNIERHEIHQIDAATLTLDQTIAYSTSVALTGLHEALIPEPSSFAMSGVAICVLSGCWLRRHTRNRRTRTSTMGHYSV